MNCQSTEEWVRDLIARRIERASYYADRVLCLVGKQTIGESNA